MRVLGIETSCDETGIAIYDYNEGLLAHSLYSQVSAHAPYGGVVPELASRDHVRKILPLIKEVIAKIPQKNPPLDGIAYTAGPGLSGALLVGACIAKSLSFAWNVPSLAIHHLEGHLLAPMLENISPTYPFLALLVSGGHTLLIKVQKIGAYEVLGESIDDAVGEAFDKTAKLLGLGYPGGAALAKLAMQGKAGRFHFPRPMIDRPGLDFSFSGLKTYAANTIKNHTLDSQTKADIALAFEQAIIATLTIKCRRALICTGLETLIVAGGVSANINLQGALKHMAQDMGVHVYFPKSEFCTDNGAMIAYAGCLRLQAGERERLSINIHPRWPLQDIHPLPKG